MLYESSYYGISDLGDSLTHHGIKGQKWGIRRFQNPDGTLTAEGKRRYGTVENFNKVQRRKKIAKQALKTAAFVGATAAAKYYLGKKTTEFADKKLKEAARKQPLDWEHPRKQPLDWEQNPFKDYKIKKKAPDEIFSQMFGSDEYTNKLLKKNMDTILDERKRRKNLMRDMHINNMTLSELSKLDLF